MFISKHLLAALLLATAADESTMAGDSGGGSLAFSSDGKWLATHGSQGLRVWDLSTGLERKLEKASGAPRPDPERHFGFTPDGKELVLYERGRFLTWEMEKGSRIRDVRGPAEAGASSLLSPDGRTFVAGGKFHRTDREASQAIELPEGEVSSLGFSADGGRIVVSGTRRGRGGWITVRETATGRDLLTAQVPPPDGARSVVLQTPPGSLFGDGNRLALARAKGTHVPGTPLGASTVLLWDVGSGRMAGGMEGHQGSVWGMTSTRDGARLATWGSADLVVWDVGPQKPLVSRTGMIHTAVFSPDGSALAFLASPDELRWRERVLTVVDLATSKDRFVRPTAYYQDLAISPDGKTLAATTEKGIRLWDVPTGDEVNPSKR